MDRFRDIVSTVLDTLATVAVAAGVTLGVWQYIGWAGLIPGGLVVFASLRGQEWYAARATTAPGRKLRRERARAARAAETTQRVKERRQRAAKAAAARLDRRNVQRIGEAA